MWHRGWNLDVLALAVLAVVSGIVSIPLGAQETLSEAPANLPYVAHAADG